MKQLAILLFCCLVSLHAPAQSQDSISEPTRNNHEFWQKVCLRYEMDNYYKSKKRQRLLRKLNETSTDYFRQLEEIKYDDAYVQDYVQGIFAQVTPGELDPDKTGTPNIHILQSPDPDAFILPNGTMIISTGLLCTLDSEEELKAIMACELAHYVLNHQMQNILRAKRASAWGTALFCVAAVGAAALSTSTDDNDNYYDNKQDKAELISAGVTIAAGIGAVASIARTEALMNPEELGDLGMKYKLEQEYNADFMAQEYLIHNDIPLNALSSALTKIKNFYASEHRDKHLVRYNSCKRLNQRIQQLGQEEEFPQNHFYHKAVSDVVTFNAMMYLNDHQYAKAQKLIQKNIDSQLASPHDYVIFTKIRMMQENTPESNEECMQLLRKARDMSSYPNLDINKQEILLLLRMKKQSQAADGLKQYLQMLRQYAQQNNNAEDEIRWIEEEAGWAERTLNKIQLL